MAAFLLYRGARDVVVENYFAPNTVYTMDPAWRRRAPFKQARGDRWDAHIWPRVDMGSLMCFEENDLPKSPLLRGDLPAGVRRSVERREGRAQVLVAREDHPRGACTAAGSDLRQPELPSRLAQQRGRRRRSRQAATVKIPAGDYRVVLRFVDRDIVVGGLVSLITLAGYGMYFGGRAARRAKELRDRFRELPWRVTSTWSARSGHRDTSITSTGQWIGLWAAVRCGSTSAMLLRSRNRRFSLTSAG